MKELAIKKLESGLQACKGNCKVAVMKKPVCDALINFCNQSEEFAQAVMQGGSFEDCMRTVAQNVGTALSDVEAYQRAVEFYFPTARVKFKLEILMSEYDDQPAQETAPASPQEPVVLDLFDLL